MTIRDYKPVIFILLGSILLAARGTGADPSSVGGGKLLFEKQWVPGPTPTGGDGLGPVFNETSCAACHNQGGIGGSGGNKHSVLVVGIEAMNAARVHPGDPAPAELLATLHPDLKFGGAMITSKSVNPMFNAYLAKLTTGLKSPADSAAPENDQANVPAEFAAQGGKYAAAAEEQASLAEGAADDPATVARTPLMNVRYSIPLHSASMEIDLRVSRRSTPSLFGHGLIDQIPEKLIKQMEKEQTRHPEISGRISQTPRGRIGKFGFRATAPTLFEFVDQACAMELGLQTQDSDQAIDPTQPDYKPSGYDISRDQVRMLTTYIAALPAPVRATPRDSQQRMLVEKGEQLFASVGCSVCHAPNLGPAKGIYSDMLLHDMGDRLSDYAPAYPHIKRADVINDQKIRTETLTNTNSTTIDDVQRMRPGYYGPPTPPGTYTSSKNSSMRGSTSRGGILQGKLNNSYSYRNSPYPPSERYFAVGNSTESSTFEEDEVSVRRNESKWGMITSTRIDKTYGVEIRENNYILKLSIEPTKVRNEWRTTPLWGLRDSAPYMHDGRAETVLQAIAMHAGEASGTRDRFLSLPVEDQQAVLAFLETLIAPPANPMTTLAAR